MIQMPYEDVISKIKDKSGLSDSEIESKLNQKLEQLSGLISKEGAAHIIANELGVKIFDQISGRLQIDKILAGMRDIETVGKVMQVFEVREFVRQDNISYVGSFIVGDETGTMRIVCWGEKAKAVNEIKQGDIIKVKSAYVKENNGRKEIHLNDKSVLMVNPPGETIGEVKTNAVAEAKRKKISELTPEDQSVELLGTIVQVFDIKFFEDKRQSTPENKVYSYVFNAFLDDGTGSVRCAFFRDQANTLSGKTKEDMMIYQERPEHFSEIKNALLGNIIKVAGRVRKNEMFDRIEFNVNIVDPKPDPEKELAKLKDQLTEEINK